MCTLGVTMGILEYEQLRLRQQEIEVKALIGLMQSKNEVVSFKATTKLEQIAYPDELIAQMKYKQATFDMGNECTFCEPTIEKMVHLKQKDWTCVCGKQL